MKKRSPTTLRLSAAIKYLLTTILLAAVLLSAPVTARADGGEEEISQTIDGYQVTLIFEKPVTSGENPVHLRISDAQGQPVSNAQVEAMLVGKEAGHAEGEPAAPQSEGHGGESLPETDHSASESSHASVESAHVESEAAHASESSTHGSDEHAEIEKAPFTAGHEAGEYEGLIAIAGPGEWTLQVHLNAGGHELKYAFPLHVASAQTGRNILLSYLAANAVIVGMAAIFKFRSAAVQPIGD